jgi:hypothetical protein
MMSAFEIGHMGRCVMPYKPSEDCLRYFSAQQVRVPQRSLAFPDLS